MSTVGYIYWPLNCHLHPWPEPKYLLLHALNLLSFPWHFLRQTFVKILWCSTVYQALSNQVRYLHFTAGKVFYNNWIGGHAASLTQTIKALLHDQIILDKFRILPHVQLSAFRLHYNAIAREAIFINTFIEIRQCQRKFNRIHRILYLLTILFVWYGYQCLQIIFAIFDTSLRSVVW